MADEAAQPGNLVWLKHETCDQLPDGGAQLRMAIMHEMKRLGLNLAWSKSRYGWELAKA